MKALRFHSYGGPEVLVFDEVPVPEPAAGQVLVKVSGSGVNPIDWKVREGLFALPLPCTVGYDFSGVVEKLGEGVTAFAVGDEVYGYSDAGTCAEYTVCADTAMAKKPVSMDLPDAAAIPVGAMTAYQALFEKGDVKNGDRVVILAASGGVGTFAVQLAKWKGAYVIATASAANAKLLQDIGADEILDYHTKPFETHTSNVDFVLDTLGKDNVLKALSVLKPGGTVVSLAPLPKDIEEAAQGKHAVNLGMQPKREQLEQIANLIEDLKVLPVIDTVVRFDEAIEVQKEIQTGHTVGKLVVRVS
jgi:NADPH:quinone reductase-like Zn-dependent oxidoreductase